MYQAALIRCFADGTWDRADELVESANWYSVPYKAQQQAIRKAEAAGYRLVHVLVLESRQLS